MRHLDLLNAFLALRFEQPDHPTCLADAGFLVQALGVTVQLADGTKLAPDVIASRIDAHITLLVEVKSGREPEMDQLGRMHGLTPEDLRDYAHLPIEDPSRHRVHIVYICNEEHRAGFEAAVSTRARVCVMGFDGERFQLGGELPPDADLVQCLEDARYPKAVHLAIVPFDDESPDEEVVRTVLPHIVDAWVRGTGGVHPDSLARSTHYLVADDMRSTGSQSEWRGIVAAARRVLDDLSKNELSEWLQKMGKSTPLWRFTKAAPPPADRTRELQRLHKAAVAYLDRIGSNTQLDLFDGLDDEEPDETSS